MAPMTVPTASGGKTPTRIIGSAGTGKTQPEEEDTSLRSDSVSVSRCLGVSAMSWYWIVTGK